jgi:hypothetical protein
LGCLVAQWQQEFALASLARDMDDACNNSSHAVLKDWLLAECQTMLGKDWACCVEDRVEACESGLEVWVYLVFTKVGKLAESFD